ncbi:HAD-IB family phosphatase [Denitratimonas sp. CY0512]|uniref:HAD-IB family phosphatase n=1 Tax=Denitratimonas sp. CY0512 TaxID=3131940 RepID=UPI003099AA96
MTGTGKDLVLFDFDGTLTLHDTLPAFMRRAVPRPRYLASAVLLSPLLLGYRCGRVSGHTIRSAIMRAGFSGVECARLEAIGAEFAQDTLPGVLRPEAMAQLQRHRDVGDTVVVVSAGLDLYLAPWCAAQGVELLCSRLERRGRRFTGRYLDEQCAGAEKARRVRAAHDLTRFRHIHAWGDTHEDAELLALAHTRIYRGRDISNGPLPLR